MRVAIVGMGASCGMYLRETAVLGSRKKLADETWVINNMGGDIIEHDLLFHMDDCKVQEVRARTDPDSRVAVMVNWLKNHPKFYTSREYADYPGSMAYPLQDVIDHIGGAAYFNSTAAYAIGYAMLYKVEEIRLYGFDFTYRQHEKAERGRACVEMLCGIAMASGMKVSCPVNSTLFDSNAPLYDRFYGYDSYDLKVEGMKMVFKDKPIPTAEEIESRYEPGYAQHLRGVK